MRRILISLFVFTLAICAAIFYWHFFTPRELTFSDGAHYAVVAREMYTHQRWSSRFSFFGPSAFWHLAQGEQLSASFLPLTPLSIYFSFLALGVSDFAAVLPSIIFFGLTSELIFLLANSKLNLFLSALSAFVFILFPPFLDYATSAATEPLFTFLLVLSFYLLTSTNALSRVLGWLPVIMTFFSRPHAFFYLPGFVLVFIFRYPTPVRKKILLFTVAFALVIFPLLVVFGGKLPFARYFAFNQAQVLLANSPLLPANSSLRAGSSILNISIINNLKTITVKLFYDSYNLIKLLPDIYPPYLIPLVLLSFIIASIPLSLKIFLGSSFLVNLLAVAASVPSFRYLHPLLPFIILSAVWALSEIAKKFDLNRNWLAVICFLMFIAVPVTSLILDSRYVSNTHHVGKPSAIKVLGSKLSELTPKDAVVVTNLDVWGSWYGDRTTIWFPLVPEQIESAVKDLSHNPADYIYITSFRADDENLHVGEEWQSLLKDPPTITNDYLKRTYQIDQQITIKAGDNYDNLPLKAVLLKKIK